MSGDIEVNVCSTCKKTKPVSRKYYHYDIKCECHSPDHFEIVWYCEDCQPKEPTETKVTFKTSNLKRVE